MKTLVVALTVMLASCATERPARAAALDPANPAAPESPPLAALTLQQPPAAPTPAQPPAATKPGADHDHDHGAAMADQPKDGGKPGTMYTCPMDPEIVSPIPGKCPKCGMKLVPKDAAPAPEKAK